MAGSSPFLTLVVGIAVLLLPLGAGAAQDAGRVEPALAAPGETIHLLYTVPSPGAVDVAVQRSATCTLTAPDGSTLACASDPTLVVARVAPGSTTYSWEIPAPSHLGNYTVNFQESSLVALPGNAPAAQAHFEVAPAGTAHTSAGNDTLTQTRLDLSQPQPSLFTRIFVLPLTTPLASVQSLGSSGAARYVMASSAGAGSLVLLLVASRFGGGP